MTKQKNSTCHTMVVLLIVASFLFSCGGVDDKKPGDTKQMRIVSVSKHLTEMLFALGKGSDIVAVDVGSTYPDSARLLKTLGYHRMLNPDSIIGMRPDLVMHSNDAGPEDLIPKLEGAGIKVQAFGNANSADSARLLLQELGNYFGVKDKAATVINTMNDGLQRAADTLRSLQLKESPMVMIIHFGKRNNEYFVMSGGNRAGDKLLVLAGASPIKYTGKGGRDITAAAVALANPDVILVTDIGFDKMGSIEKFIDSVPGVALTNAGKSKRILRVEEHDLVYFGPRSGENIIKLMHALHLNSPVEKK